MNGCCRENNEKQYVDYYLNEFGKLLFAHKTDKHVFVHRAYHWSDRYVKTDESKGRITVIETGKFSEFDKSEYRLVTLEEFKTVEKKYGDIYKNSLSP